MKKYHTHYAIIAILLSSFLVSCDKGYTLAGGASGNDDYARDYHDYTNGYCAQLNDTTDFNCYYIVNMKDIKSLYGAEIYESQLRIYNCLDGNRRSYIVAKVDGRHQMDMNAPMYMAAPGSLCPDACDLTATNFVVPASGSIRRLSGAQPAQLIKAAQERYRSKLNIRQIELPGPVLRDHANLRGCEYMLVHHVRIDDQPKALVIALSATGAVLRQEYYVIDGDNLCPDACDLL